jgi:hypothetical protein
MGGDWPFQDIGPNAEQSDDDVKRYGSGLSGRAASISLPARADRQADLAGDIDTVSTRDRKRPMATVQISLSMSPN